MLLETDRARIAVCVAAVVLCFGNVPPSSADTLAEDLFRFAEFWHWEAGGEEPPFAENETAFRLNLVRDTVIDHFDLLAAIVAARGYGPPTPTATSTPAVTPTPHPVAWIEVSPERAVSDIGEQRQMAATAYDTSGLPITNVPFTWKSSDSAVGIISPAGLFSAFGGGNAWLSASAGSASSQALASVNPQASGHNCRPYEWYRTQMGTGYASSNNCGPTSTHMAIKWCREEDVPTVEEIRDRHPRDGGWWYTSDITESLGYYGVPYATHSVGSAQDVMACLERGRVVLVCVEMKWVTYNRQRFYGRFYTFDSGHFLIIKGWSEDGQYFIVYDPNSWQSDYYPDGTMMGRNRFYRQGELINAITHWWAYGYEIGASPTKSTADPAAMPLGKAGPRG